jgi:hypothetical protein
MIKSILATFTVVVFLGVAASTANSQLPPPRERLGIRAGYVEATGKFNEHFGDGSYMTLHFSEKVVWTLYVDFRIGATYMGDLLKPEIAENLTNIEGIDSEMRILFFTVGPQYTHGMGEKTTWYGSFGLGVYSVSILHDTGIQAFDYSDQHFGINGGLGVMWRFAATWNVEFNVTTHKFWTPAKRRDLYYIFTEEDTSPLMYQFGLGVSMDLR